MLFNVHKKSMVNHFVVLKQGNVKSKLENTSYKELEPCIPLGKPGAHLAPQSWLLYSFDVMTNNPKMPIRAYCNPKKIYHKPIMEDLIFSSIKMSYLDYRLFSHDDSHPANVWQKTVKQGDFCPSFQNYKTLTYVSYEVMYKVRINTLQPFPLCGADEAKAGHEHRVGGHRQNYYLLQQKRKTYEQKRVN